MRKRIVIAGALSLALALSACGGAQQPAQEPAAEEEAAAEETAEEVVEEEATEEAAEEEADQGPIIEWANATSAEEAAKGAGFERFGVIDKFTLGDLEFANPSFSYAGGVAQAMYETPATAVFIRKAEGYYDTPLSDRALDEFAAHWTKTIGSIEVNCYGPARGAVTVATWTDGFRSYGITFQGLGGEEMSMDTDELEVLVKGISEADADQTSTAQTEEEKKAEEEKKRAEEEAKRAEEEKKKEEEQKQQEAAAKSNLPTEMEADAMVEKASGGSCVSVDKVTTKQYGECWYCVAVGKDGTKYEYYVDKDGAHLINKTAPSSDQQKKDTSGGHYEGENVTIFGSIYAEWHQANGQWYATFVTYNGTQIFAEPAPAGGGWKFNAIVNGKPVLVFYSEQESSSIGQYGPAGVSSHWLGEDGKTWY